MTTTMSRKSSIACCLLLLLLLLQAAITASTACTSAVFPSTNSRQQLNYSSCSSLQHLGASLHWTYHPSNATVDVAYRAKLVDPSGWVGWGLNPSASGMVGGQVLLAFPGPVGGSIAVYTTAMDSYDPAVRNGTLSFPVYSRAAEYGGGGYMTIYAHLQLPKNATKVNHVWQAGSVGSGGVPATHPENGDNARSKGTIDFLSGQSTVAGAGGSGCKNTHGVLNAVSWGILMPMGAIIARYLKVFKSADPAWFYLHIACQLSAYAVGVAGWATGLELGSDSSESSAHRNIGITLFCLATLQVFALLLRPNKEHKYRIYWNAYHHSVGYTVVVLSVINIFKGLDLLDPEKKWATAYIAIIVILGAIALVLEVVTWVIVLKRRS